VNPSDECEDADPLGRTHGEEVSSVFPLQVKNELKLESLSLMVERETSTSGFQESGIVLFYFSFIFVSLGESCLLVSWCAGGSCGMACSDEDCGRSRRPGAEDRGWSHMSVTWWPGGREVGWRHVWSAPGTWRLGAQVSWLSLKTKVDGL
jgi:hypothetical protein